VRFKDFLPVDACVLLAHNVRLNEENNVISSLNENGIIEENYHVKSENDNDNFINKEIIVNTENPKQLKKTKLLDLYETVSIYEAFNESDLQTLKQNENKLKKIRRSKKMNKQASLAIDTIEIVDQNVQAEVAVITPEPTITPLSLMNNHEAFSNFNECKLPLQARSSSVLVGQSDSKNSRPKSVRSASYIGNYNNGQQQTHETIQMGDI
jgi:hypothetical protein